MITTWTDAIIGFQTSLRAADRSEQTIWLRGAHIGRLAAAQRPRGPWDVTGDHLVAWVAHQNWSTETRRSHRSSVRLFYEWAQNQGYVPESPALALSAIKPAQPRPRPAPEDAYRNALRRAKPREHLALRLGAEAGMRRGEMVLVNSRDLFHDGEGYSIIVHGKGRKERVVPITNSLAAEIRTACSANPDGWAFPGQIDGHLSPAYLAKCVSRLLPEGITTHSLRHRFGTRTYAIDRDILTVQALLGHASPETTQRYVKLPSASLRRTVEAAA